jgi:hypothetical protein
VLAPLDDLVSWNKAFHLPERFKLGLNFHKDPGVTPAKAGVQLWHK